ncbi:FkbM family methyltransferase [Halarcobacter ebronensis]|uniref:FkbM family methyltransferase n=1 Tax=Halarcobacter ebronensis TaxID=1462615 RepID=A0A4Q1ANP6_9BACT|nr:FkbM family methyltransferase [Halarcobacter ebronensis]QKF83304.1 methyltransferase, FkbM family [Halarcobacter ebronensis]RXK05866.1 FkbM family methyltransferase [Halarcobacter ebronensis]
MIFSLNDIPKNKRLIIYGYGHAGQMLLKFLSIYRPNQTIKCIVDDNYKNSDNDLKIITFEDLNDIYSQNDLILVTLLLSDKIEYRLRENTKFNYSLIRLNYFHDDIEFLKFKKFYNNKRKYISKLHSFDEYKEKDKLKRVLSIFTNEVDKELYSTIVSCWHEGDELIQDYFVNNFEKIGRHYLEYLDFSKIKNVIEGGVADGINSIEFLSLLSKDCKIFGFDPIFNEYNESKHKKYLEENNNFEVILKGLWDVDTNLEINISDSLPLASVSEVKSILSKTIEVTSIDNFMNVRKIDKLDFLKLDIEGAEYNCLKGAINTLKKDRPQLSISIYHKYEHLYEIPLFLYDNLANYTFRLGQYHYEHGETVLYAIPNELI